MTPPPNPLLSLVREWREQATERWGLPAVVLRACADELERRLGAVEQEVATLKRGRDGLRQLLSPAPRLLQCSWMWSDGTRCPNDAAGESTYCSEHAIDAKYIASSSPAPDASAAFQDLADDMAACIEDCGLHAVCEKILAERYARAAEEGRQVTSKQVPVIVDGFPRRNRVDLYTPAELAIRAAVFAVEEAGCDPLLTEAVNLLQEAREKVADYVERDCAPPTKEPGK